MNAKKSFKQIYILLVFSIFSKKCKGEEPWTGVCRELTIGYNLTDDYDTSLPPSQYTRVSLVTHIFDISEVDDFKRLVTVRFATSYGWKETRINFQRDSIYGSSLTGSKLNSAFVENCLWHPGFKYLFVDNKQPDTTYLLTPNHLITAEMEGKVTITCDMDFQLYPFDKQLCYMQAVPKNSLGIFTSNYLTTKLTLKREMSILQYFVITKKLGLTENIMKPTQGLTVRIELQRDIKTHITETFLPTFLVVVISWVSLSMPPDIIPGRAGLLITLTLVITNISLNLSKQCPRSNVPNQLFIWVFTCFGMTATALVEYAVLLFLMRIGSSPPLPSSKINAKNPSKIFFDKKDNKLTMDAFCKIVDAFTLIALALSFAIFNCYYWSTNLTTWRQPFPKTDSYLTKAAYNISLRIQAEKFKGKPMRGSDVSWCSGCNYPDIAFDMSCGTEPGCSTNLVEQPISGGKPADDCPEDLRTKCIKCQGSLKVYNVTCTVTADNILRRVRYKEESLAIEGDKNDWGDPKTFSFRSEDSANPGEIKIEAEDTNSGNHCAHAGLMLLCEVKDERNENINGNPWHGFTSNSRQWREEGGSEICNNTRGIYPRNDHHIKTLREAGAMNIWAVDKKSVTMIGSPIAGG